MLSSSLTSVMGSTSGAANFTFPSGLVFRFGSLDFFIDNINKLSLFDSNSNQSGRNEIASAPFGILNAAEVYSKAISSGIYLFHSEGSQVSANEHRIFNNTARYHLIVMELPPLLTATFGSGFVSPTRVRPWHAPTISRPALREVGFLIWPIDSSSTTRSALAIFAPR